MELVKFHNLISLSSEQVATIFSVGWKSIQLTPFICASVIINGSTSFDNIYKVPWADENLLFNLEKSQILKVLSSEPETIKSF